MSWITNYVRPKIRALVLQKEIPDNMWDKCLGCDSMLFHREFQKNLNVCHHCGHHMMIGVMERLDSMFDDAKYEVIELAKNNDDPLKFKDVKKYSDRLKDARSKTKRDDAIVVAYGKIKGNDIVISAFDFKFMGGSMGKAVGDGIVKGAELAVEKKCPFMVIPASGGARMQESTISLMQMPRSIVAVEMVKDAGLPYIVLLTYPTTGGVSASFAMVGDIHIAEPKAMIGFAGRRVIEETIREKLPADFQTAEYLLDHGMVDMVVHRQDMAAEVGKILDLLMVPNKADIDKNDQPETAKQA